MKRRKIVVALVILGVAAVCGSYALAQKETGRRVEIKLAAAKAKQDVGAMREAIHLQSEMMEEPLLAGQIAIMRIKDIALASKNSDVGVKTLLTIVTSTDRPALKRSALMAAGELYERSGNPTAAIKMMVEIVKLSRGPEEEEQAEEEELAREAREVNRWLAEHPEVAAKIIHHQLSRRRGGPARPHALPGGLPHMPGLMPGRERRERGLAEMDRRLDRRAAELKELAERLGRHRRELDERAEQLERRSLDLKRLAERLEKGRRERPEGRRRERDEHREGDERRERAERREGKD